MEDTAQREAVRALIERRPQDAIERLARMLAAEPDNPGVLADLCDAHTVTGDLDEAIRCGRRAVALEPRSTEAMVSLARALRLAGRYGEGRQVADGAVRLAPDDPAGLQELALNASHLPDQYRVAHAAAVRCVELAPQSPAAHRVVGYVSAGQKDEEAAERAFRTALQLDPGDAEAMLNLAAVKGDRGDVAFAVAGFVASGRLDPRQAQVRANLRWACLRTLTLFQVFLLVWWVVLVWLTLFGWLPALLVWVLLIGVPAWTARRVARASGRRVWPVLRDVVRSSKVLMGLLAVQAVSVITASVMCFAGVMHFAADLSTDIGVYCLYTGWGCLLAGFGILWAELLRDAANRRSVSDRA